jgi:TIR domain
MKAFISYSHHDRKRGSDVKKVLSNFEIEVFLAHDDVHISQEWRDRIIRELKECKIFVPLLNEAFKTSDWAPQEMGVAALRRGVLIIPLSIDGTVPFGFISHLQGKPLPDISVPPLGLVIDPIVKQFPSEMIPRVISRLANSPGWRSSEALMELLLPYFSKLTDQQVHDVTEGAIRNSEVWSAGDCVRTYLPKFIEANKVRIDPERLEILRYQLQNQEWYQAGSPGSDSN